MALLRAGAPLGHGVPDVTYSTRFTNAKTRLVRGQETTAHIAPTRRITHHANGQAVDTG